MKKYNKSKPLILIHIPKTAGVTVKKLYKGWFGDDLLFHYKDWKKNILPPKVNLYKDSQRIEPYMVYGHFNSAAGFGIEEYYPEVDQFIVIIREPFEQAISGYFYVRRTNPEWRDKLNLPSGGLREYIRGLQSDILKFFPEQVSFKNYKEMIEEKFVEVGVTEHLDESMIRISKKLNKPYLPGSLDKLNISARDGEDVPYDLKEEFMKRHQLEYDVYNYVLNKYK